ncbi:MAG: four helix bundle protein [Candidatus Omnitrophica bacterium]|nr:four helix bundle protein [Candidatus Omnitrophota bacterium]
MNQDRTGRIYDLEDRTRTFAKDVRKFIRKIPKDLPNLEDAKQLVRASGSIGANYIEANEALGKKDFIFRLKVSRKEAKEARYWLGILDAGPDSDLQSLQRHLHQESDELMKIFGAIVRKLE